MFNLSIDYNVEVMVKGLGRSGISGITDIVFTSSDPNIFIITDTDDPAKKVLETVSLGSATITVAAKNASGVELSTTETVVVMEGEAQALLIEFGNLIPKPVV